MRYNASTCIRTRLISPDLVESALKSWVYLTNLLICINIVINHNYQVYLTQIKYREYSTERRIRIIYRDRERETAYRYYNYYITYTLKL